MRGTAGHIRLMGIVATGVAAVVASSVTGCAFDVGGPGPGQTDDGAPPDLADAATTAPTPDAAPGTPDARPHPDAMIPDTEVPGVAHARFGAVTIDAELSDWGGAHWYTLDAAAPGAHTHVNAPGWPKSTSVQFAVRWTADMLYFAFQVSDDNLHIDSTSLWNDDSVEVYLDPEQDAAGPYGSFDHWVVFAPDAMCQSYDQGGAVTASCVAVQSGGEGWVAEGSIAMASLGAVGSVGAVAGFDVGVNDDDDMAANGANYDGYAAWYMSPTPGCVSCCGMNPHPDPWCDTSRFGTLVLDP